MADLSRSVDASAALCVLLIDDHALFRAGMRFILAEGGLAGSEVLEAGQLSEAMALPQARVDVVLLDVELPGISGVEGIALLKRRWPKAVVLMLSAHEGVAVQQLALKRGAAAFVSKSASPEQIRALVLSSYAQVQLQIQMQAQTQTLVSSAPAPQVDAAAQEENEEYSGLLSARQLEVLVLMCEGMSNKAIARKLFVSENTVRTHVAAVIKHFDVSTRMEAAVAAQRMGVVKVHMHSRAVVFGQ